MAAKRKTKKRSKKMKKNEVQVPFPIVLANVLVLVAVLGLSYMWLCARCDALGKQIKSKEAESKKADRYLAMAENNWAVYKGPGNVERALRQHRLSMRVAHESQRIKVMYEHGNDGAVAYLK